MPFYIKEWDCLAIDSLLKVRPILPYFTLIRFNLWCSLSQITASGALNLKVTKPTVCFRTLAARFYWEDRRILTLESHISKFLLCGPLHHLQIRNCFSRIFSWDPRDHEVRIIFGSKSHWFSCDATKNRKICPMPQNVPSHHLGDAILFIPHPQNWKYSNF